MDEIEDIFSRLSAQLDTVIGEESEQFKTGSDPSDEVERFLE